MSKPLVAPALCLLAALAVPLPASAHQNSSNTAFVQVGPQGPKLQIDLDGQIASELSLASPATDEARRALVDRLLVVSADARPCPWGETSFYASPSGRWLLTAESRCRGAKLQVVSPLFDEGSAASRGGHALQVRVQQQFDTLRCLFGQVSTPCELSLKPPPARGEARSEARGEVRGEVRSEARAGDAPGASRPGATFLHFGYQGLIHILRGLDHLLFLALAMASVRGLRQAVVQISAFTLGHSVTLALAALSLLTLPATAVEVAIALSIVLLAVERLRGQSRAASPWVTGLFGLLHGLGFGAGLKEQGFGGAEKIVALAGFNAGVELGQLALALPFVALCLWVQRRGASRRLQLAVALPGLVLGAFWAAERLGSA